MRIINMMVLVAGAAIVASCSDSTKMNHEVRQTAQSERIGFVTYSEKTTRADETNSVNLYDFYKTFDVYAWKNANSQVQSVFNHIPVEYFTEDTVGTYVYKQSPAKPSIEWGDDWKTANNRKGWFYEEVRYWDKLATSYNFYAIAPYEVNPSPAIHIEDGQDNITIGSDSARYKVSTEKNLALVLGSQVSDDIPLFAYAYADGIYVYSHNVAAAVDVEESVVTMRHLSETGNLPSDSYNWLKMQILNYGLVRQQYYYSYGSTQGSEAVGIYSDIMHIALEIDDMDMYERACILEGSRVATYSSSPALSMIYREEDGRFVFYARENLDVCLAVT